MSATIIDLISKQEMARVEGDEESREMYRRMLADEGYAEAEYYEQKWFDATGRIYDLMQKVDSAKIDGLIGALQAYRWDKPEIGDEPF